MKEIVREQLAQSFVAYGKGLVIAEDIVSDVLEHLDTDEELFEVYDSIKNHTGIDLCRKVALEDRKVRMADFPGQIFTLHYAGWDNWWIVRNSKGIDMGRFTEEEVVESGYLIPE